ncbi:MAG: hypothetical protein KDK28_16980 [Maritimibacter sp.]|nr:hypothetical protein [Maritimibacter sp.]
MTDLIYRGIAHTGTKTATARIAQPLIYRGVAHDGIAPRTTGTARAIEMCYRGVRHGTRKAAAAGRSTTAFAGLLPA